MKLPDQSCCKDVQKTALIIAMLCFSSTLGEAWAQLKKSLADEAEVHLKFSSKVNGLFSLLKKSLPSS